VELLILHGEQQPMVAPVAPVHTDIQMVEAEHDYIEMNEVMHQPRQVVLSMEEPEVLGVIMVDSVVEEAPLPGAVAVVVATAVEEIHTPAATAEPTLPVPAADPTTPEPTRSKYLARTTDTEA
jgi:hypothetical protein